jgi:Spy/CpxP family protein refolding chaperone
MKTFTALLGTLFLAGTLMAQVGDDTQRRHRRAPRVNALVELLELEEQQMTELRAIQSTLRETTQPITQELRDLARQLRDVMKTDPVDETTAAALRAEIKAQREEMDAFREEARLNSRNVLTEKQLDILAKLEEALALQNAAQQAVMLNLIEGPESGRGFARGMDGRNFMGRRGQPGSGPKPPRQP